MKLVPASPRAVTVLLPIVAGPAMALVAFVLGYWLDPLSLKEMKGVSAFFLSVLVLMIGQWLVTIQEMQKTAMYSDRLYDAIKNYLHVTTVGSPEAAMRYVLGRLPVLREVRNTSFNTDEESDRADEKLYQSIVYDELPGQIQLHCRKDLIWTDIGDAHALARFREILRGCPAGSGRKNSKYRYRLISHVEPQINFILLEYESGEKEVLFNWDFRSVGRDPTVLISRDAHIVEMFTIQFNLLWRRASEDHDNQATRSTSMK